MTLQTLPVDDPAFLGYVLAFAAAAVACFGSAARARRIDDPDTRRGLVALLLTSGGWATAHVAFFLAPGAAWKVAVYTVGLVVGIAAVGPWLYFCSAYTGRSLHRNANYRRAAVVGFLAIVAVKLTNPLHHFYYRTEVVAEPFPHLAIHHEPLHWAVMGLSYALATVGYFVLLESFRRVGYETWPLAVLVGVSGLPVVLDVVGFATPLLVDITYEPLGVAAFSVGVLFLYLDRFRTVRLAGEHDEAVVVLSDDGRIREFNRSAADLFPELAKGDAVGRPLEAVLPGTAAAVDADPPILAREDGVTTRFYRLSTNPVSAGQDQVGRILTVSDVTERERYRRQLERQNERLERFADLVSHDLRNPLEVANAEVALAREDGDPSHLVGIDDALDRMEEIIDDLLTLAREGRSIDETEPVSLATVARDAWGAIRDEGTELVVAGDLEFEADESRMRQLLENLMRNAVEHGSTSSQSPGEEAVEDRAAPTPAPGRAAASEVSHLTVTVGPLDGEPGFYVADDGPGIPPEEREAVLEAGYTTDRDGTGFGLSIVAEIAGAHGWTIAVTESRDGGARFDFSGVELA